MSDRWYDLSPTETAEKTNTNLHSGLTSAEANSRIAKNGLNAVFPLPRGSFFDYVRKLPINSLSILLALSAVPSALFGHTAMAIVLVATLMLNYITVALIYVKAQRVIAQMGRFSLPTAKVLRDGKMTVIRQENVVTGDIIFLSAGDIVPCDARLIEDDNLFVLETGITEARFPIRKDSEYQNIRNIKPHEALNMVYASTIVQSGKGKAIACRTGKSTLVCQSEKNKAAVSYDKLGVFDKLHKISFYVTLAAILLTFILTVINMIPGIGKLGSLDGLLYSLSFGCGAMTEFYAIFGYIIVAVGVFCSMNRTGPTVTGALIKNAEKLEKMCGLDTLIIPPEAVAASQDIVLDRIFTDNGYDRWYEKEKDGFEKISDCSRLICYAVVSTGIYGSRLTSLNATGNNVYSSEEEAIIRCAEENGLYNLELDRYFPLREHLGKCEYCRFDVSLIKQESDNIIIARAAADDILNSCSYYRASDGAVRAMNNVTRSRLSTIAAQMTRERGIVIGIATNKSVYNSLVRLSDSLSDMIFEGFLGFSEPMLTDIELTISKCKSAGISVLLFVPDKTERGIRIANAIGIIDDADRQIADGKELAAKEDGEITDHLSDYVLYENMDAQTERRIIKLLRGCGRKVGFLGLRFEEITAMREADVSFTQSITLSDSHTGRKKSVSELPISVSKSGGGAPSGCDAMRFVSDVILSIVTRNSPLGGMNALLSSLERAMAVYYNISRLMTYLLTVNTAKLILLLFSFFTGTYFLTPVQMLICGMVYDLASVMVISFEKPQRDILGSFRTGGNTAAAAFKDGIKAVFEGLLLGGGAVILSAVLQAVKAQNTDNICTPIFISMLIASLFVLVESGRKESLLSGNIVLSNMFLTVMFSALLFISCGLIFPKFGGIFGIYRMGAKSCLGIFILISAFAVIVGLLKYRRKPKKAKK